MPERIPTVFEEHRDNEGMVSLRHTEVLTERPNTPEEQILNLSASEREIAVAQRARRRQTADALSKARSELGERTVHPEQSHVIELTGDMWEKYKAVRLKSGETDPQAFGASVRTEAEQSETYWRNALDNPALKLFAVEAGGDIVALAGLKKNPDGSFKLRRVYVAPEQRGHGLAQILLERVFVEARKQGASSIWLSVAEEQTPAIGLYSRLGFTETGSAEEMMGDGQSHRLIVMEKKF